MFRILRLPPGQWCGDGGVLCLFCRGGWYLDDIFEEERGIPPARWYIDKTAPTFHVFLFPEFCPIRSASERSWSPVASHLLATPKTAIGAASPEQVTKDMIAEVAEQDRLMRRAEETMRTDRPIEEVRGR